MVEGNWSRGPRKTFLIADDGTRVTSSADLEARNAFFAVIDGAEIPGSLNSIIEKVDCGKLRELAAAIERTPGYDEQLLPGINFYKENASAIQVYASTVRGFQAGRTLRDYVYIRGVDENGRLLGDSHCYISIPVEAFENIEIATEGKEIPPKVGKQIIVLVLVSKIAEMIGKPYCRYGEGTTCQTMSPARLLNFGVPDQELITQIKEALYVNERM